MIKVDIRIIAASNEDLTALIKEGKFREDLYYRLKVIEIPVPSLEERKEDIPELAEYFLKMSSKDIGRTVNSIDKEALQKLIDYPWPGNVRELKNVIEHAIVLGSGEILLVEHLPLEIQQGKAQLSQISSESGEIDDWTLSAAEKRHIIKALEHTNGNKSKAAQLLGISRNRLDRKL